ncbi:MAG: hydrolase TatD [Myxococcaceae bacterium]|nr:hydrolase TatD [Myxococcaceae bacterium]
MFDARLDPEGLSDADLETLRQFGVRGGLVVPRRGHSLEEAAEATQRVTDVQVPRLGRAGFDVVTCASAPLWLAGTRGLARLLDELPEALGRPGVVALGPLEWSKDGPAERELLETQLRLAGELGRPVVITAPRLRHEALTARLLASLDRAKVEPHRVLIDGVSVKTVRSVLARGHLAALSLHPERLGVDLAERLIHSLGPERLVLATGAGDGPNDLLALPRLVSRLKQARLSAGVISRVSGLTLRRFLGRSD